MQPRTRRWITPTVWAVALSVGAGYSYARYAGVKTTVDRALSARPGLTHIDLTHPGSVTTPIPQSPGVHPHSVAFYLKLEGSKSSGKTHRLKGLRGSITLTDDSGGVVELRQFDESMSSAIENGDLCDLGFSPPVPGGGYTMTVTIESGASATEAARATVYGRYMVCEMEMFPALEWLLLTYSAGGPALVFWLIAIGRVIRTPVPVSIDQA
ncbi:Uncharacterized protein OS=Planctomyces maris DSM 8797 GN=PM8797T_00959 PE=4 SV=1 [Gemmata massiliana]|uniref:Uncharacterized protein n=1 Tax=Gemmata massiliana TaxID=1210884 RepID=A0A6P2DNM0_9BACT|nr:hypothetical protein [Gemmata massiliana]VTS03701.1 Uncharacterized protein OS=Planctomyces maris DSM 8797 GN=PM8797T_00959 PE=4 SV=1 [Gemmata massiliana]